MSTDFQQAFEKAAIFYQQGDFVAAESAYKALVDKGENRVLVLRAMVELYMQTQRPIEAVETLKALIEEVPDSLFYYSRLVALLEGMGQLRTAIDFYKQFLQRQPTNANACFNLALLYKKGKRFEDALKYYEQAISLGIDGVEEVYCNMGVLYSDIRQAGKAREMYEKALNIKPGYAPAMFNLAGSYEESGKGHEAVQLYQEIIENNPQHWESLSRLVYGKKIDSGDGELIDSLQRACKVSNEDPLGQESIHFALGKAYDDLDRYEEALAAYDSANNIGKLRNPPYERNEVEKAFDDLINGFSIDWSGDAGRQFNETPIFICGMFRSGSTLIEQILSRHASITAGGELDYLQWLLAQNLSPFPERAINSSADELKALGNEYFRKVQRLFPDAKNITDKQPDNFLYLALITKIFPNARIIFTSRNKLDNCLSIYFQQLGGNLAYATDIGDTAHYYDQHTRLMSHWHNCFPDNIFTVNYDELVKSPEPVLRKLIDFLGLEWDDSCLSFQESDNPVKTASVWQVRGELHANSSGRWRNYEPYLQNILESLN